MDPELHLTTIATEGAEVAMLPADGLSRPVRACPGWDVERLVGHLGRTHVWAAGYLASDPDSHDEVSAGPPPPQGHEILSWYRVCLDELLEALERHTPTSPARNFTGRGDAAFWFRRQAHEITMHRWDAEDAITPGGAMRSPSLTAADGIDEWLEVFVPRFLEKGQGPPADLVGRSLHIHCTDDDLEPGTGEWLLHLTPSGCEVERTHAKGDAALRGPAFDILLAAWHRIGLDNLDVVGDADRAEAILDLVHVT